jgi:hypothetical protein
MSATIAESGGLQPLADLECKLQAAALRQSFLNESEHAVTAADSSGPAPFGRLLRYGNPLSLLQCRGGLSRGLDLLGGVAGHCDRHDGWDRTTLEVLDGELRLERRAEPDVLTTLTGSERIVRALRAVPFSAFMVKLGNHFHDRFSVS